MEDKGYRGNDAEETTKPSTAPEEGFLAAWLLKKETKEDNTETDDDKENNTDKKQKKRSAISRFISGLLGERDDADSENDVGSLSEATTENEEASHVESGESELAYREGSQSITEAPISVEHADEYDGRVLKIEHPNEVTGVNSIEVSQEQPTTEINQVYQSEQLAAQQAQENSKAQELEKSLKSPETNEASPLDRKFKREIRRLKKRVKQQEAATKKIKTQAKEAEDQLQVMREQQIKFEANLVQSNAEIKVTNTSETAPEMTKIIEKDVAPTAEKIETIKKVEKLITQEDKRADPQEVLKTVIEAMDNNLAIERQLEQRQELKDRPPNEDSGQSGATSVSTILQTTAQHLPNTPVLNGFAATSKTITDNSSRRTNYSNFTYLSAVMAGFLSAIAVIIVLIMLKIIF